MLTVPVVYERSIHVAAPLERVYALVSDYPRSAAHFPGIESFTRVPGEGNAVYEWVNQEVSFAGFRYQARYRARFERRKNREVSWSSIDGQGNVDVTGRWDLAADGEGTELSFRMELGVRLKIPRLLSGPARKAIEQVLQPPMRRYLEGIKRSLEEK